MASPYALPMNGSTVHHGHGHGHVRSTNQPIAVDRLTSQYQAPIRSPLRNEASNPNLHSHAHSRAQSGRPEPDSPQKSLRHAHSTSQLPRLYVPAGSIDSAIHTNDGPNHAASAMAYPQSNGYGFPPMGGRARSGTIPTRSSLADSSAWITPAEALAALCVPLPFLLASMTFRSVQSVAPVTVPAEPAFAHLAEKLEDKSPILPAVVNTRQSGLVEACSFTCGTLLLVGIMAKLRLDQAALDRRKQSLGQSGDTARKPVPLASVRGAQRVLIRALGIGLPFYAALKLGGARTAAILLLASAAGLSTNALQSDLTQLEGWKRLVTSRRATIGALAVSALGDLLFFDQATDVLSIGLGYTCLFVSIFFIPPPYPTSTSKMSSLTSPVAPSTSSTSAVPATPWDQPPPMAASLPLQVLSSSLISTPHDIDLTLHTSGTLGVICFLAYLFSSNTVAFSFTQCVFLLATIASAAGSIMLAQPSALRTTKKMGLAAGLTLSFLFYFGFLSKTAPRTTLQMVLFAGCYAAVQYDADFFKSKGGPHQHHHHHHDSKTGASSDVGGNSVSSGASHSRFTGFLLELTRPWPLFYSILVEKDSRRIFYFMTLNFGFMLVQTFYGVATGSLGLLSDSIHMLFDCLALLVGLCAAVMSKWPPSVRFPYGLGKMDTLAGFANGIFLMLISIEIVTEAIERLYEGSQMERIGELLTVSALGLCVNLVGMMAFDHAHHGHSHGHGHGHGHEHGHGHGHGHSEHTHNHSHSHEKEHSHAHDHTEEHHHSHGASPEKHADAGHAHAHAHAHSHSHPHSNDNMHGIFLHVLADTLGSVAVVGSTLLIHYFQWPGFDPLASCLIAVLIFASAIPLVQSSAKGLLLTVPADTEYHLRDTLAGVSELRGVRGYCVPRFWIEGAEAGGVMGVMHVVAGKASDIDEVRERVVTFLSGKKADVVVQVEREGDGRCWCGGGMAGKSPVPG